MTFLIWFFNFVFVLTNASYGFLLPFQSYLFPNKGLSSISDLNLLSSGFETAFALSIMASSQVEIASSNPFGHVLRDHKKKEIWNRESNARSSIRKNLKNFVQSCISPQHTEPGSNLKVSFCNADSVGETQDKNKAGENNNKPKENDEWAKAREIRVVSSLVQRWRDFEAESKNLNSNSNSTITSPVFSSRSNSGSIFSECSSIFEVPLRNSEASESVEQKYEAPSIAEEFFMDSESGRTTASVTPARSRDSNATENEKIRVADIIKRLTSINGEECSEREQFVSNDSFPKICISLDHVSENRGCGAAIASPRLRGRQAYNDLLIQMERDRQREIEGLGERKAVSRFSHRGRIQALLRLKLLRQGQEVENGSKSNLTAFEKKKHSQGSNIMHLRERFNTAVEHSAAESSLRKEVISRTQNVEKSSFSDQPKEVKDHAQNPPTSVQVKEEIRLQEVIQHEHVHRDVVSDTLEVETCSTSDRMKVDIKLEDVITSQNRTSQHQNSEYLQTQTGLSVDVMGLRMSFEVRSVESQESADTPTSLKSFKSKYKEQKANKQQSIASLDDWIKDVSPSQGDGEDQQAEGKQLEESGPHQTSDFSEEWEEEEELSYQQVEETNQDWIYDISRPRSAWEDLRQERYQEMLDPFAKNGDIKQLLERRSVSTFLSSGMRDRIDQLMISRTQVQSSVVNNGVERRQMEKEMAIGEEKNEVAEENKRSNSRQYCEVGEYVDQTPTSMYSASPSLFKSWSCNQDHDVTDDSVSSPSPQQSLSSSCYTQDNQQFPPFRNYEMEFVYDLRGHIEQLHQEISDLRKALNTCMSMQLQMQQSMKQETAISSSPSAQKRATVKGDCRLCCESEVDSLLYRCGHMCTCFKCAQELQCGSGKCPICRAPILDVVRTYPDNYRGN